MYKSRACSFIEDHPSMGKRYCPMCGSPHDNGDWMHEAQPDEELALSAIRKLCRLLNTNTKAMKMLAMTVTDPEMSMSEISRTLHVTPSMGAKLVSEIISVFPEAAALVGALTPAARGQKTRREREKQKREIWCED